MTEKQLLEAAKSGRLDDVKRLLHEQVTCDCVDDKQNTPLHLAADAGHVDVVQLLLEHGAEVDAGDEEDTTALMLAAAEGHEKVARLLIQYGADVNAVDHNPMTPLMWAATEGHDNVVHVLIGSGAQVDAADNDEQTPLTWAAMKGHDNVARTLIESGAQVDAADNYQRTPLIWAAMKGHEKVVQMLIENGAQVDAVDNYQRTPLMWAASEGHKEVAQQLIDVEAKVNAADKEHRTPLIWAAQNGKYKVVQLLISAGASVNVATNGKQTALMVAAQDGHESIVRALIEQGSLVDATNYKRQTALMLAASEGHLKVVQTLLKANASIELRDSNDETALMYTIDSNHHDVVQELMNVENEGLNQTMALLKLGLHKRRNDAAAKKKALEDAKAEVKLADLVQLCSKMHEAQMISERICSRLLDVEQQLSKLNELTKQEAIPRFKQLVSKTHGFLLKHGDKHAVTRLVGAQVIMSTSHDLNRELDAFILQFDIQSDKTEVNEWEKQLEADCVTMKSLIKCTLSKQDELAIELQDLRVQREALTLLMFECDNRASQYTEEEMALIHKLFQDVSSMSQLKIDAVPEWFVPPHEVGFNAKTWFARGSYGSVHHGTWNGTAVVIKLAILDDKKSRGIFLGETEIWIKLQHPHIVRLFKACHVGNPFFVCEWASNGTLSDYLCRENIRFETWDKLHEAAQGLRYLHSTTKVVHGDLKCNNILIGADGKAKLTDFGLSFVLGSEQANVDEVGAISWKAPEIIDGKTRGTFASDVYSFGMCIIEAVTGRVPWGMMPDVAVKYKTLREKALPKQPSEMNDEQWDLVKCMCAWEPSERITISKTVEILAAFANAELCQKNDVEWAEFKASQPVSEPDPRT